MPSQNNASPSAKPSGQSSRRPPPTTTYPRWPDCNEESEYCEVPPEHFLAQQGKAASRYFPGSGEEYAYLDTQRAQAGPSSTLPPSPPPAPLTSRSTHQPASSQESVFSRSSEGVRSAAGAPQPLEGLSPLLAANSLRPVAPEDNGALPAGLPDTSTLAGADFDVDVRSGFLPPEAPLERLPEDLPEAQWEHLLTAARDIGLKINGGGVAVSEDERRQFRRWRRRVRQTPIIHPSRKLQMDIRFARRGHVVLTFLAHFYVHSLPEPHPAEAVEVAAKSGWLSSLWSRRGKAAEGTRTAELDQDVQDAADELAGKYAARVPASIAGPLLALSAQLDIPPILTYADTVLWNWRLRDPSLGLVPSNFEIVETFSGTASEKHFFLVSLLIELRGVAALDIMRVCLDECFLGDALAKRRVANYLVRLGGVVKDLEQILHDVRTDCDPATFYWGIRPWFRGGDASPHERKGWFYPATLEEESDPALQPRLFTGPSAGQSSLIHAIDVFLDVDHAGVKERRGRPLARPAPSAVRGANGSSPPAITADATSLPEDATFMQRMQLYMPGHHRRFLTHLQSLDNEDEMTMLPLPRPAQEPVGNESEASDAADEDAIVTAPAHSPVRRLALSVPAGSQHVLPRAYDQALSALRSLRDEHMRVATLYIVTQSRSKPPKEFADLNASFVGHSKTLVDGGDTKGKRKRDGVERDSEDEEERGESSSQSRQKRRGLRQVDTASTAPAVPGQGQLQSVQEPQSEEEGSGAKGTGGTNLVQFLKACRTNTVDTLLADASSSS
ncbi:unnamed protein product [Parajaminaea phylloscopi]